MNRRAIIFALAVTILLGIQLARAVSSVRGESQTVDEGAHLAAGYSYWRTGDFRLNPEHPPLQKLLASVPLLFLPIHIPTDHWSWEERNQWAFARELLYRSSIPADDLFFAGRLSTIILSLFLGLILALWARQLWGNTGGLLTLLVFSFDPTILAHGRYVTTDMIVALLFTLALYTYGRFLQRPTSLSWLAVILLFALAQGAKFSAVILWPIFVILWIIRYYRSQGEERQRFQWMRAVFFFSSLLVVSNLTIWALYGFEVKKPLDDPELATIYREATIWDSERIAEQPRFARLVLLTTRPGSPTGEAIQVIFDNVPIPAYTYFRGLSSVLWHNYWGHSSYLMGDFRSTGWWYYFPVAFLVKTPPATVLLLLLTILYLIRLALHRFTHYQKRTPSRWSNMVRAYQSSDFHYTLLLVPIAVYSLTSLTSNINLGIRHFLPVYPLLFLLIGNLATVRSLKGQWLWKIVMLCILTVLATSSIMVHPHYLAYFSELVGGPEHGARYLTDSNLDWGQELKRLGIFLEQEKIPFVYITYFGQAPLEAYLHDFRSLPTTDDTEAIEQLDGWAAISATALFSKDGEYDWLRQRKPDKKIGYAIFLYDLRKERLTIEL